MDEPKHNSSVEEEARNTLMYRAGPFKGKTAFIERVDRIRIQVELGFRASLVVDFRLKNILLPKQDDMRALYKRVKSCLVVMIGGHPVVMDGVEEPWDGVYPANIYARCGDAPEGVTTQDIDGKTWMDLGSYLNSIGAEHGFDADTIRKDFLRRR